MTEKELDNLIETASETKVKTCLKYIASLWFVEEGKAIFDKELNSNIIEAVTGELARFGFCPPQEKE